MMATLQELIDLTPDQKKAWDKLEKAHKEFKKAGGKYYNVQGYVQGYNGKYIADIGEEGEYWTADVHMPGIDDAGLSGFADDWHGFTLKNGVEVCDD